MVVYSKKINRELKELYENNNIPLENIGIKIGKVVEVRTNKYLIELKPGLYGWSGEKSPFIQLSSDKKYWWIDKECLYIKKMTMETE